MCVHRLVAAVTAVLLASCSGYMKPREPDRGLPLNEKINHFSASNGFRVFVLPDTTAPVVRLELRYEVGAMDDPPGKGGMAHLIEHLMFQTRLPTPAGPVSVASELSRVAQSHNAATTLDSTHYAAEALPEQLPALFAIEMNRLASGCSTWDEQTFLREREVVRNEIRERYGSASGSILNHLYEAIYPPGHPYRHTPGGSDASVASIQLSDVCAFVAKHYRPTEVSIFAVGATDEPAVRALAQRWLTRFPKMPALPPLSVAPVASGKRRVVTYDLDIDEPQVFALFPLPPEGSLDHRIADMVRPPHLLLAGLAFTYKWGHGAASFTIGGARAPVLAVTVTPRDLDHVDDAIDAIFQSVRRARRDSGHEVNDLSWLLDRENQKADILAAFEALGARAWLFADYVQFGVKGFLVDRLREVDRLEPSDVRRVADAIFDPDRAKVVVFRPRPGAQRRHAGSFRYRPTAHDPGHWKQIVDLAEADRPVPLPAGRRQPPAVQRADLPNGLRVFLWPHGTMPLVHARLVVAAGLSDEPAGRVGIAMAAGGAGLVTQDTTVFGSRHLATEVHLVVERLSKRLRLHRTEDFDDWREMTLRALRQPRAAERTRYERALGAATFGTDHPYARDLLTEADIPAIRGDAVAGFQRSYYTAGNTALILAGKFDPALVREHLVYQFGHLDERRRPRPAVPAAEPAAGQRLVAGAGEAGSPVVDLDLRIPGGHGVDRRHAARLVLARILDAELRELREHQAVTYGMYASHDVRRGPGEWRLGGSADATRAASALTFILDRLHAMRRDPMAYRANFVIARRALVQDLMIRGTSPAEVVRNLIVIAEHDLPDDYFDRLLEDTARVTPDDVHRVLLDEIDPARLAIGAFGAPPAVDRVLTAARAWRPKK